MTKDQEILLLAPFKTEDVQWRLGMVSKDGTGGYALPYLDSRAVQHRLDDVIGRDHWQNSFQCVATGNPKDPVANICTISIFSPEHNEWISKSDGAGETDFEPIKGGLSDAFKRAASMWGCGRYMYSLDSVWIEIEKNKAGKNIIPSKAKPKLNMEYEKAVKRIFGSNTSDQSKNQAAKPSTAIIPKQSESPEQQQRQEIKPMFKVVSSSFTSGKNQNTAVKLIKPDGNPLQAYIQGKINLKEGQNLFDVTVEQKEHDAVGKYFVIADYKLNAA